MEAWVDGTDDIEEACAVRRACEMNQPHAQNCSSQSNPQTIVKAFNESRMTPPFAYLFRGRKLLVLSPKMGHQTTLLWIEDLISAKLDAIIDEKPRERGNPTRKRHRQPIGAMNTP